MPNCQERSVYRIIVYVNCKLYETIKLDNNKVLTS